MIRAGTVSVEDGVKSAEEYAPARKVRVELSFDVPEGNEAKTVLDYASASADAQVNRLLKRPTTQVVGEKPAGTVSPAQMTQKAAAAAREVAKRVQTPPPQNAKTERTPDPSAVVDEEALTPQEPVLTDAASVEEALTPQEPVLTDAASVEEWEQPKEINDDELFAHLTRVNGATKNGAAIRALIEEFTPKDRKYQAREIAQDKRAAFIERLKTIPKVA
jgi:hypothetical protein